MIGLSSTVRVMLATRPVDFRKGMDGLAALVRDAMGADPFSGTVYVFRSKRADRVKLLVWDGSGRGPRSQASGGWPVLLAEDRGRRGPAERGAALGARSKGWTGSASMRLVPVSVPAVAG